MHVIATAGHVDHGKSTLVQALTGIDPDRLTEEKERGLTIDLGFAWMILPSGRQVDFVDVPGHRRFIKNALAGVGSVDACLFVVAATEGWKPQSEEHLRILDLLGISNGVIAITKAALIEEDDLIRVADGISERLQNSTLAYAPVVPTDAPAGIGLAQLIATLDGVLERTPEAADHGRPRLWIDRSFCISGSGTVATGTLTGGGLKVGDELCVAPGPPPSGAPLPVRIRGIQTHSTSRSSVRPGHRVALAIVGSGRNRIDPTIASRGTVLVNLDQWQPTMTFDASLKVTSLAQVAVRRRGAYHVYLGSGGYAVQLQILSGSAIPPGAEGFVRIRLPHPLPLLPRDKYILRDSGRFLTIGGGEVLDVSPVVTASRARPDLSVDRVVAERGWVKANELERLTGERRDPSLTGGWIVAPRLLAEASRSLLERVGAAGWAGLDPATCTDRERTVLDALVVEHRVQLNEGRAFETGSLPDFAAHPYVKALKESPFAPPVALDFGMDRAELRQLIAAGLVVEHDGCCFAKSAVEDAGVIVTELLSRSPDGITVSMVRDRLKTTRKYAVPLLALLDELGITCRSGALRIAGSRDVESATA